MCGKIRTSRRWREDAAEPKWGDVLEEDKIRPEAVEVESLEIAAVSSLVVKRKQKVL